MRTFKYSISPESLFIDCISIVEEPAVESNFQVFNKQHTFSVEGNHILAVAVRCNHPIFRSDSNGDYNLIFDEDVCDYFAAQLLKDASFLKASLNHDGQDIADAVTITSIFQNNKYVKVPDFPDIKDHSVFVQMTVNSPELLDKIKAGKFNGFSVELYFDKLIPTDTFSAISKELDSLGV